MTALAKRMLYRVLGPEHYLRVVSRAFLRLYRLRLLKKTFPEHYFIESLVRSGDHVIDIGANLGYYTIPLSRLVGPEGHVYAVEPIPLFAAVLRRNLRSGYAKRVTVIEAALGARPADAVEMSVPVADGILRHGLAHVGAKAGERSFTVPMQTPALLFADIPRLDYVKCDIEGYEAYVLPAFGTLFRRFRPVVQVEISSAGNRETLFRFFGELGYEVMVLHNGKLELLSNLEDRVRGDYYFVPPTRLPNTD